MSQMSKEEYDLITFQKFKPEPPEKKEKSDTRRFWFLSLPIGVFCGFVGLALTEAGSAFFFFLLVGTIVAQAVLENVGRKA